MNNETNTAIDTLQAMYVATRDGAPLDLAAYVEALLRATAERCDVHPIERAFEGLGYWTRLDIIGACAGAGARTVAVRESHGWLGAIAVASALGLDDVWAAAMTAHFGPVGTHKSRCDANDVPTLETLAQFPRIGERMAEAARVFEGTARWYDRVNAGRSYPLEHVVRYSPPASAAA